MLKLTAAGLLAATLFTSITTAYATATNIQRVEVAFVLDTTGSMGGLIDGAKRKIWSIATTIVEAHPDADVAMALVAYRDREDEYIVQTEQLTEDVQGIYGKLVRLEANGGGDTPESVNEALNVAVNKLNWSSDEHVKRIVFLVGDAPPHMDYPQEKQYPQIVREAKKRGIVVNAVQAGDMFETTTIWQEIAQHGGGRFMAIPQDGGEVSIIITPYDDDIMHMQGEIDRTVVPYGAEPKKAELADKIREKAAAPAATQIENSEYYAKRTSKREVVTGGGDLISDFANKDLDLEKVKTNELPVELQDMKREDQKAWITQRAQARNALELKMYALIAKRDEFIKKKKVTEGGKLQDSFDEAVKETLRLQLQ
jgi:Mg-chelatase subunit ChlD